MKPKNRIENLEDFVEHQRYLIPAEYRVMYDEETDTLTVDFKTKTIREDQLHVFQTALRNHMMGHVKISTGQLLPPVAKQRSKQQNPSNPTSYTKS